MKSESEVAQSCLTLCDPMDCSPPGSSVHKIFQAKVLEWGAIAFSQRYLLSSPLCFFSLLFCTDPWGRLPYLSLLFLGTLHSDWYTFAFLLWLLLIFFSQLFVRPPPTTTLPFCISFFLGTLLIASSCTMLWTSVHSSSGTLSIRSNPLNHCQFHCLIMMYLI